VLPRFRQGPVFALIAITALVLAACEPSVTESPSGTDDEPSPSEVAEPEPQELLVLEWSGYEAPDFWTDFAGAYPDVDVTFEFGISDADILALMEAGSQADVFHFYSGWQDFYVDEGLVLPIDTSKLSNWDLVPDSFKEQGQVDGVQYYLPWDWGFTSILHNTAQVPEVTSWDVLFNADYVGHISMWNDGPAAVTVSSYVHGYDETAITDDQLADIEAEWIAQKPLNGPIGYWSAEYTDLCPAILDGSVWVAYAWQGCYATALYEGTPVAYATPVEGRNSWIGFYGISATTESPELAYAFIDAKLAELTCSNAVNLFYYGCANQAVMDAVEDPILIEAFGINDPSILETTNFTPPVTDEQRTAWTDMWARVAAE